MGNIDFARTREGGFSLLEVLIAVAILGIVALGIVGLFSHSIVTNASGYDYAVLTGVARQALEQLQALPFTDPALDVTAPGSPRPWTDPTGSGRYTISYTVSEYNIGAWNQVTGPNPWPTPDPSDPLQHANLKRITLGVVSQQGVLLGNRQFVATALKAL